MSTLNLKPHVAKPNGMGQMVLIRSQPYARLKVGEDPPVFIQGGKYYGEGGPMLEDDELPPWLDDEIARMRPGARQEVGLKA